MVRNPNWQEADQLAISLQVIRNVFVATPVQVIFAWPAINSLYSYTSILLFLITTDWRSCSSTCNISAWLHERAQRKRREEDGQYPGTRDHQGEKWKRWRIPVQERWEVLFGVYKSYNGTPQMVQYTDVIGHFRFTLSLFLKASRGAHPFIWKWDFIHMQIKQIFIWMVEH